MFLTILLAQFAKSGVKLLISMICFFFNKSVF